MTASLDEIQIVKTAHPWLRKIQISSVFSYKSLFLDKVVDNLLEHFRHQGHKVQSVPENQTDVILTSARFCEPISWREALIFSVRRRFTLTHTPTIFTLLHATPKRFEAMLDHFRLSLEKDPINPEDFSFPGLAPQANHVLIEQGQRGGPILALERLVQAQAKSIHILLVIGTEEPEEVYLFNLVGAHPRILGDDMEALYEDIMLRIVTVVSTHEVTNHTVTGKPITKSRWKKSTTPRAMCSASLELGKRDFFTPMIRIVDLVQVPAVEDVIARQYSEGCFATWEPELEALVATVTGSARPVDKGNLNDDDLAVIVDVQPNGSGVMVQHVEGKRNAPPSSEAVEMMEMDRALAQISLSAAWNISNKVPVMRSKLHGHRGVAAFNPQYVEHVPLGPSYYHFPVSCATEAQARGLVVAFSQSEALRNPKDPRKVIFTVLPGHGVMIVEKWVQGKEPFQVIWEYMDTGFLKVENRIPQGPLTYVLDPAGLMILLMV
jgi:hypothetical protein